MQGKELIDILSKTKRTWIMVGILLSQSAFAGDIEQILPADSNFTIDGNLGTEVMRVQSDGLVGIGTTTPNEVLEVNGHIRMTDGSEAANTVMIGDVDGTASWGNISLFQDGNGTDDQQITDFNLTGTTLTITLEDGGTKTVDLSGLNNSASLAALQTALDNHIADDNDTDSTNELLTSAEINGTTITIIDAGNTYTLDLSDLNNSGSDTQNLSDFNLL